MASDFVILPRAHDLKTWPRFFQSVREGEKRAEIRKNDRGFAVGDVLTLREWNPESREYSGRFVVARVTHILYGPEMVDGSDGLASGFVSLSIDVVAIADAGTA
jgi:hypothetical protein